MSKKSKQRAIIAQLEALYARLPTIACKGRCSIACGPIPMTITEAQRLRGAHPQLLHPSHDEKLTCVYLNERKRCTVYSARPYMCRAWGLIKNLSCMHGCVPERWLSSHEFLEIAQQIERLGGEMVVTVNGGVMRDPEKSLLGIRINVDEQTLRAREDHVLSLRALYGGRILGVVGDPAKPVNFLNVDRQSKRGGD